MRSQVSPGASGFAILYNSTWRAALAVGGLAVVGNLLRLSFHDAGLALASATFLGALVVGLAATWVGPRVEKPRIALTVPGIMIPGLLAYDTMTLFNRGDVIAALKTGVQAAFILGAMAMDLGVARILTDKAWALHDIHRQG
ncbi:threonine/serine exporter family protein [Bradyrhizobium cenepequi]|uniref:threonine/serine exporter family protein n=1 Tax=Bradyrhizobium cenepequi TaxID=2821403 RepID=UPI001CE2CCC9|nr:threonine/serine exporter family protein [Bradyrhizobium cenepequi]MCA6111281.1 threonine/serine exporter family protein [Bradyrhizobium cenepequi]